ncbi:hypothetical protein LBBP_04124 [Leptospira borgpetersenii serovar Ballum]|uniref:Uncharacterized protein n=1 Tax=Leptospira borgpetersenii serovar Ballum TaxID=280505 RepID=A0A0S2IX57_LEPBO|nr:hypothetical protein LBBP_04124 [Leptospira borgpetersenii serovar Ballum]
MTKIAQRDCKKKFDKTLNTLNEQEIVQNIAINIIANFSQTKRFPQFMSLW